MEGDERTTYSGLFCMLHNGEANQKKNQLMELIGDLVPFQTPTDTGAKLLSIVNNRPLKIKAIA